MISNSDDKAIVDTILYLSQKLNKKVIAEGVEKQQQYDVLKSSLSSAMIQGFLFSKPKKLSDLLIYIYIPLYTTQ